jgi:DNA-binding winged helix-turn-helix (wHTH) protein
VTQNLPVLLQQQIDPGIPTASAFSLETGPPLPVPFVIPPSGRFLLPNQARTFVLPKMRMPTVDAWNLTIQRALTPTLAVHAAYVGNKGTHVFPGDGPFSDLNQPSIAGFDTLSRFERQPFYNKFGWTQEIAYSGSNASNSYHSLQLQAEKRFTSTYEFLTHYTWSKSLGYNNDYFAIDPNVNYGLADSNRKHAFVLVNVIDLPLGRNRRYLGSIARWQDWVLGGWTLAANTNVSSGLPFTPTYLSCGIDIDTGPCRPNQVGPIRITGNRDRYFATTGGLVLQPNGQPGDTIGPWQRPASGTFGDIRRNSLYGPCFQADLHAEELYRNGVKVKLQKQPFQVLAILLQRQGDLVTREELRSLMWPSDTFVDFEHSLNVAVRRLREGLGDDADRPVFIETLPRRGYRFLAPVSSTEKLNGSQIVARAPVRQRYAWLSLALLCPVILVYTAQRYWHILFPRASQASAVPMTVIPFTTTPGAELEPTFSPDGKAIAFLWDQGASDKSDLYVKLIGAEQPLRITHREGGICNAAWSPDWAIYRVPE